MNESTWGMCFNRSPKYRRYSKPEKELNCPDWFEEPQFRVWQEEGLIVWNNIDKKIEALNGSYTLRLLSRFFQSGYFFDNKLGTFSLVKNTPAYIEKMIFDFSPPIQTKRTGFKPVLYYFMVLGLQLLLTSPLRR